jgi:phage repressor protein C with HTH and peptisase S24 domain
MFADFSADTLLLSVFFLIYQWKNRKISMSYAKKIIDIRNYFNSTNAELEKILGLSNGYISNIEKNETDNPGKLLLALTEKGISADWFLTDKGTMLLSEVSEVQIDPSLTPGSPQPPKSIKIYKDSELPEGSFVVPLLDQKLSAGPGSYLPEDDEARGLVRVPGYLSRYGENVAALPVDGDSMEPTLHRGDMVVCDSCGWSGEGIYAVKMGDSGFVKRITKRPGRVVVISDNPKYPPQEEPEGSEDFQIIGRVHCAITKVE